MLVVFESMIGIVEPAEEFTFYEQMELVKSFCCLGDKLDAGGESEAAVTTTTRIG